MDCKTAHSLITAAVDGELDPKTLSEFHAALEQCDDCKQEFLAQKETKALLQARLKRVKAPQSLIDGIKRQIAEKSNGALPSGAPKMDSSTPKSKKKNPAVSSEQMKFSEMNITANSGAMVFNSTSASADSSHAADTFRQKAAEFFFINPNLNSRYNNLFAAGLALTVMAMLIFAAIARKQQGVMIDTTDVAIEATPNIYELTENALLHLHLHQPDIVTDEPKVIENFLSKHLGDFMPVPKVAGFSPQSVRLTAFLDSNAGEVIYASPESKQRIVVYVIHASEAERKKIIPKHLSDKCAHNQRDFFNGHLQNGYAVTMWQWGSAFYAATAENSKGDLATIVRNPNW